MASPGGKAFFGRSPPPGSGTSAPKPGGGRAKPTLPSKAPRKTAGGTSFKPSVLPSSPCFMLGCPQWLQYKGVLSPRMSKDLEQRLLSSGALASLLQLTHVRTGECVVLKQYPRDKLLSSQRAANRVTNEWHVHSSLDHPNILPLWGGLEDRCTVGLLMELQKGDVLSHLEARGRDTMAEGEARALLFDLLSALDFMHSKGFVHRDVKSENIFEAFGSSSWRLGDFGSAVELSSVAATGGSGLGMEGTPVFTAPEYAALWKGRSPEQLLKATTTKLDVWGVGAVACDVLLGHPPFSDSTDDLGDPPLEQLAHAILSDPPRLAGAAAAGLSPGALSFIGRCLEKDPQKRADVQELLRHPWLTV